MRKIELRSRVWPAIAFCLAGCLGELEAPPAMSAPAADPGLARVLTTFSPRMVPVSERPQPSTMSPGTWVEVWVSEAAAGAYGRVRPDVTGSRAELPVGAAVVRTLRDADGQITRHTALVRREAGYNPPSDLWFAVYDPEGAIVRNDTGLVLEGPLAGCTRCHLGRAEDGYLFGLATVGGSR